MRYEFGKTKVGRDDNYSAKPKIWYSTSRRQACSTVPYGYWSHIRLDTEHFETHWHKIFEIHESKCTSIPYQYNTDIDVRRRDVEYQIDTATNPHNGIHQNHSQPLLRTFCVKPNICHRSTLHPPDTKVSHPVTLRLA